MDAALREMLTETVTIAPVSGRDEYGALTYGPPVSHKARIHRRIVTVFAPTGRQLVPETKVYFNGDVIITEGSRLTLPDGSQPPIQGIETHTDETGAIDHYTVFL